MHKSFLIFGTLIALLISLSSAKVQGDEGDGGMSVLPNDFKFSDFGDEFAFLDNTDWQLGDDDLVNGAGGGGGVELDDDQGDNDVVVMPGMQPGGGSWRANRPQQAGGGYIRPASGNRPAGDYWRGQSNGGAGWGADGGHQVDSSWGGRQDDGYQSGGNWQGNQDDSWQYGGNGQGNRVGSWQYGGNGQGNQDGSYQYGGNWAPARPAPRGNWNSNQGGYYSQRGGSKDSGSVLQDVQGAVRDGFQKITDGIHHALRGKFF